MEYFVFSVQTRRAGHLHQTSKNTSMSAEIAITIQLIIVFDSPVESLPCFAGSIFVVGLVELGSRHAVNERRDIE